MSQDRNSIYSEVTGWSWKNAGKCGSDEGSPTSADNKLTDSSDCQLAWESRWEGLESPHILILGELPFLTEIAEYRTRRYRIPPFQRFRLSNKYPSEMTGFCAVHENAFARLGVKDRLEVIGQFVQDRLLLLFRLGEKWCYEYWGASALASHLKQSGLRQIGTLYLIASRLGAAGFLPSFAQELTYQGIQYHHVCGPEGWVHVQRQPIATPRQRMRVIARSRTYAILREKGTIAKWGPMLREGGPDFNYEIIVQVGDDPRIEESAGTLVANSPFRSCWIKWDPVRGNWEVLYGEPRFLKWDTRWAVVGPSQRCPERGDLFAGLDAQSFAIAFLGLLHAVEAWQEIHGKLSHLLLIGPDLFLATEKKSGEFAIQLAHKFAALGCRLSIRVRSFVQQKDIAGRLYSGYLTGAAPILQWNCHLPAWELGLHWNMGRLVAVDTAVYEPEVPFREPGWLPPPAWRSSLGGDFTWISKCIVAIRWREKVRQILTDIFQEKQLPPLVGAFIPLLETAALHEDHNLLWLDLGKGGVFSRGTCCRELREFETYLSLLFEDLFGVFEVDGDLRLQRRVSKTSQKNGQAFEAALSLLCLIHSEREEEYVQRGLEVRLCSEFLKNLGERIPDKRGILERAWRAISRDYATAETAAAECRRAILGALVGDEVFDDYELARIFQFSARCIQNSAPSLSCENFSDATFTGHKLLGNACECLPPMPDRTQDLGQENEAEKYLKNIEATAQGNSIGSFRHTPYGILWQPPPFAVVLEIDLRAPWICFGTQFLYHSTHGGRNDRTAEGMPFVHIEHAAQLPFVALRSRIPALDLWHHFGGASRECLPLKPDAVILPVLPTAWIDYEWASCDWQPHSPSVFKRLAETGRFHPLYREFDNWHVVWKLNLEPVATQIEVFLDFATKILIFPKAGAHSPIRYSLHGSGGNYRCLICFGFHADIECANSLESWTFESCDNSPLKVSTEGVEGEGISIRFTGVRPRKVLIFEEDAASTLFKNLDAEFSPMRTTIPVAAKNTKLPGMFLGIVDNLHLRFDPKMRSLYGFDPQSFQCLGPLKTIYARTSERFDRVGMHDGCCFAVEYLLSAREEVLELTYRLSPSGWALIVISTDIDSFFTELKQARQIKCPLDEFLLRWLDVEAILGVEEGEEDGILPRLAEVVLVCPKSQTSSLSPLWLRTSDNRVIWQGHSASTNDSQMFRLTMLSEPTQFLFQRNGETFFKNTSDARMFRVGQRRRLKYPTKRGRWLLSSQNVYALTTIPLHIGWQVADATQSWEKCVHPLGDQMLRCPISILVITSPDPFGTRMIFLDVREQVALPAPLSAVENRGWFLGRTNQSGFGYWWLPRDKQIVFSRPLSISSVLGSTTSHAKCGTLRPPESKILSGAGIADGFLHVQMAQGNIYRRLPNDSWQIIRAFCAHDSAEQLFSETVDVLSQTNAQILPLEILSDVAGRQDGWFIRATAQILKAPPEAGNEAVLLGSSRDGEKHYVFGQDRIFEISGSSWAPHGRISFALRKNGVVFLVANYIADPPILNAEKLILVGSPECLRWRLGEGLLAYQTVLLESSGSPVIAGILDLRPLSISDCGCWIEEEDFVIAELTTGNRLIIRNGTTHLCHTSIVEKLRIRFGEFENCLSLQNLLDTRGKRAM
ncbi:MAG: hypothetical protein C5B47_05735 [Verrucomicrobia bacterium]|nr:MAG: hypothetical protein C5B47_05735 [Verrucomicrobiota bacterium]